jgi:hypothetical protein
VTTVPVCSVRGRNNESLEDVARLLRDAVMRTGYHRTLISWPMTTRYASMDARAQAETLEYLRWCRDLILVFTRYGSARTRVVLGNIELTSNFRDGVWNQSVIFEDWFERNRRQQRDPNLSEIEGWLPTVVETDDAMDGGGSNAVAAPTAASPEQQEFRRRERTRLLSLDGLSDPRRDRVTLDEDYAILHPLAGLEVDFQAADLRNDPTTTAAELGAQQDLVFSLEGRFPLMPRLSS